MGKVGPRFIEDSSPSCINLTLAGPQPPSDSFHVSYAVLPLLERRARSSSKTLKTARLIWIKLRRRTMDVSAGARRSL
jgi:hypothetical protein